MKREHKIHIERDGRWWMVHIPELNGLTQARRLSEAETMAREWIAVSTGTPIKDITVRVDRITVSGLGEIAARAQEIVDERDAAVQASQVAQQHAADYARALSDAGIPVRDAATLLALSPQRISQIARAV